MDKKKFIEYLQAKISQMENSEKDAAQCRKDCCEVILKNLESGIFDEEKPSPLYYGTSFGQLDIYMQRGIRDMFGCDMGYLPDEQWKALLRLIGAAAAFREGISGK